MVLKGFGKRLKDSVKNSSYTQKQIAEILNINQDTFSNYVKEVYYPKADTLFELCNILDISPDWFLSGQGMPRYRYDMDGSIDSYKSFEDLNDYEKELIFNYRLLTEREQGRVDQFVYSAIEVSEENELKKTINSKQTPPIHSK
ncbi:MAG: helix-turn-helix transcriptional regulator [Eubacteriales bacterium]